MKKFQQGAATLLFADLVSAEAVERVLDDGRFSSRTGTRWVFVGFEPTEHLDAAVAAQRAVGSEVEMRAAHSLASGEFAGRSVVLVAPLQPARLLEALKALEIEWSELDKDVEALDRQDDEGVSAFVREELMGSPWHDAYQRFAKKAMSRFGKEATLDAKGKSSDELLKRAAELSGGTFYMEVLRPSSCGNVASSRYWVREEPYGFRCRPSSLGGPLDREVAYVVWDRVALKAIETALAER